MIHLHFNNRWQQIGGKYFTGTVFLQNEKRAPSDVFDKMNVPDVTGDFLNSLNGFWAAVITDSNTSACVATDRIRSCPVFYAQKNGELYISSDAYWIREQCNFTEIDKDCENELLMTEQILGCDTLFKEIKQVQAGEIVKFYYLGNENKWDLEAERYYRYLLQEPYNNMSREELLKYHDEAMVSSFKRLMAYANGRTIVIPLSGGYDSRLILLTLKKLGYPKLLAFSYGVKGNEEAKISQEVAEQLGVPWLFSEYTYDKMKPLFDSKDMAEYQAFAANFSSLAHTQDWFAVKDLKDNGLLPQDSIFVPGHSSEVPAGSHSSEYPLLYSKGATLFDVIEALENKIYTLSELCGDKRIKSESCTRLLLSAGDLNQYSDPVSLFDSLDIAERQAKFIVNSVRVYEYFGYDWWLPYYDIDFLNCWGHIPVGFHYDRNLYYEYIVQQSKIMKLFPGNEMKRDGISHKNNLMNKIKHTILHSRLAKPFARFLKIKFGRNMTLGLRCLSDEDYVYAINTGANSSNGIWSALYVKEIKNINNIFKK